MPFSKLALKLGSGTTTTIDHFPFEITVSSDSTNGTYALVRPGTLNGIVPANIFDILYIDDFGTYYVKLQVQTDGVSPTYSWVYVDSDPGNQNIGTEGIAPNLWIITLGAIVQKKVLQVVYNNLRMYASIALIQSIVATDIGGEPYIRWYMWNTAVT